MGGSFHSYVSHYQRVHSSVKHGEIPILGGFSEGICWESTRIEADRFNMGLAVSGWYLHKNLGRTHIISAVPHCIPVYPYLGLYSLVKSPCLIIRPEMNPNFDSVNLQIYHRVFHWAHHILTNIHVYNVKPASWHQTQDNMNERCNLSQLNALFAEGGAHIPWTQNWPCFGATKHVQELFNTGSKCAPADASWQQHEYPWYCVYIYINIYIYIWYTKMCIYYIYTERERESTQYSVAFVSILIKIVFKNIWK